MAERYPIDKARRVRSQRAAAFLRLEEGEVSLRSTLRQPPAPLQGAILHTVLLAAPGMGAETVRKVCTEAKVWPLTVLGSMTQFQRQRVIEALPERIK